MYESSTISRLSIALLGVTVLLYTIGVNKTIYVGCILHPRGVKYTPNTKGVTETLLIGCGSNTPF
jgi:hypothetical protein